MQKRFGPGTFTIIALLVGALCTIGVGWTQAFLLPRRAEVGWPAAALSYETPGYNAVGMPITRDASWQVFRRHPLRRSAPDGLVLPLHPLWPGFVIDAAVLAAFVFGAVLIPRLARRQMRLVAGQCPTCGFPAGRGALCTECGESLAGVRRR